jgi:hypothetical protein
MQNIPQYTNEINIKDMAKLSKKELSELLRSKDFVKVNEVEWYMGIETFELTFIKSKYDINTYTLKIETKELAKAIEENAMNIVSMCDNQHEDYFPRLPTGNTEIPIAEYLENLTPYELSEILRNDIGYILEWVVNDEMLYLKGVKDNQNVLQAIYFHLNEVKGVKEVDLVLELALARMINNDAIIGKEPNNG